MKLGVGDHISYYGKRIYEDNYGRVFTNAHHALLDCDFKIKHSDIRTGKLIASSGMSFTSWGESITLIIRKKQEKVQINMVSKPYFWDIGNSRRNVNDFFGALDERLSYDQTDERGQEKLIPSTNQDYQPKHRNKSRKTKEKETLGYIFLILGILLAIVLPIGIAIRGMPENGLYPLTIAFILIFGSLFIGYHNLKHKIH